MQSVKVKDGQTLFDIAIQCLGNVARVFDLAQANSIGISDKLASGQLLMLPEVDYAEKDTVDYFTKPLFPTSGDPEVPTGGGIGFMQIGTNFIVSGVNLNFLIGGIGAMQIGSNFKTA